MKRKVKRNAQSAALWEYHLQQQIVPSKTGKEEDSESFVDQSDDTGYFNSEDLRRYSAESPFLAILETILEKSSNDEYLVEYKSLTNDDGTEPLKEKTNIKHIRPYPPQIAVTDYYSLLQEVDALYNDGWWVGVISKVLQGKKYFIYFRGTNEEMEFVHSDVRPHQDWIDGKWVVASKAAKL